MDGTESQGISRVGKTVLVRLMKSQIWYPPASSVALGGRPQKRDNDLCLPFCLGERYPPALALMPDTSVSLYIPLCLSSCYLSPGGQRE